MQTITTEKFSQFNLEKAVTTSLKFKKEYEQLKIKPEIDAVIVHIPVEKYTEENQNLIINTINVPDGITLKPIPNEVQIKYIIPLSKIAKKQNLGINVFVDYNDLKKAENLKLVIHASNIPDYFYSFKLIPQKVEYIIKK